MKLHLLIISILLIIALVLTFIINVEANSEISTLYEHSPEFKQIILNVESWRSMIKHVMEDEKSHIPIDFALAIVAKESKGNNSMIGSKGERCIFQVLPAKWMGYSDPSILENYVLCTRWALYFLESGLEVCNGDEYCASRVYNCGPTEKALVGLCGQEYATRVQEYWRPYFTDDFEEIFKHSHKGLASLLNMPYINQDEEEWWKANDCGPVSAAMLVEFINHRKVKSYEYSVDMGLEKWDERYQRVEQVGDWLKMQGIWVTYRHPSAWNMSYTQISLMQRIPIIVLINHPIIGNHYVVVIGMTKDDIIYHDPLYGPSRTMRKQEFEDRAIWYIVPNTGD